MNSWPFTICRWKVELAGENLHDEQQLILAPPIRETTVFLKPILSIKEA